MNRSRSVKPLGQQPEGAQGGQKGRRAGAGDGHPGGAGAGRADDGLGEGAQGGGAFGGVVADPLDVKQAPACGERYLLQLRKMRQPLGHAEVGGVVDRCFRPERFAEFAVLLYFRLLIVHVQGRGDILGDDAGAEPARRGALALADDPAAEDQRYPVAVARSRLSRIS